VDKTKAALSKLNHHRAAPSDHQDTGENRIAMSSFRRSNLRKKPRDGQEKTKPENRIGKEHLLMPLVTRPVHLGSYPPNEDAALCGKVSNPRPQQASGPRPTP
jgi:hypothetical protein